MVNAMKMKRHCRLLRLLPIFVLALMSPYCHGETLGDGYGVSENCIVATPVGYEKNITLSNGEAAALQGFPKSFKFCGSRCDQYKQIGNSVPPPFAYCIAVEVMKRFVALQK